MKFLLALLLVTGCATGQLRTDVARLTAEAARIDTVRITDSVAVISNIVSTDSIRDTLVLNLTDTVLVKRFITRVDTLKLACERCTISAAQLSAVNDTLRRANAKLVARLDRKLFWTGVLRQALIGVVIVLVLVAIASRLRLF
jgi:hypothetical protein